ncbi:porphobilinogen synthase [Tessaracoccus sp. OS52]|uniref:porphobilinogen synthase n=1 Tax=Tessaracoccus sp. OS52 TaxID=2886691 RepID=UPI001D1206C0|nr:porphobilinogen synthase [Tessaracoccus sp. OS52]MCC2592639.1 porphobilinogen synthase [Tessaracoccus sp. OS52]
MTQRPRRLRTTPAMRALVRETRISPQQLVLPVFVGDSGAPISSMPGVSRHSLSEIDGVAARVAEAGLGGIMLFGVPEEHQKDETGSAGIAPDGILQRALERVRSRVGDAVVVMADTCLDEFTSHGHCGLLDARGRVDNDATVEAYQRMAVAQARAGAHVVAPSGMMDAQVAGIRSALDGEGFTDVSILAYSAKYASAFYGPFREAVSSSLQGDRRTYQQDPANRREGLREALLDLAEGADMVMVKPASHYLDVLADVAAVADVPVAAYQVSGEYSMIEAAAERGWIDRRAAVLESVTGIVRAGADVVLTYWAEEIAEWLN